MAVAALVLLAGCLPLGTATATLGNDPTRAGAQPGFWAAISGPFTTHADGDPYSTECAGAATNATTCGSGGVNGGYQSSGYEYWVNVPAGDVGSSVTVQVYDPAFGAGDAAGDSFGTTPTNAGFATSYQLFDTTGNPENLSTNPSLGMNSVADGPAGGNQGLGLCTNSTPGYHVFGAGTASQGAWYALCTFTPTQGGLYPLVVRTSGIPGVTASGGGSNDFSLEATTTGTVPPSVSAVNDLSVNLASPSSGSPWFHLVAVGANWAGHLMVVDVFDPGDAASGDVTLQVLAPPSGGAEVPTRGSPVACSYSDPTATMGGTTPNTSATCTITTRDSTLAVPNRFKGKWLRVLITVPTDYTCSDCWWTVKESSSVPGAIVGDRAVYITNLGPLAS